MIQRDKLALIHVAKSRLQLDDADYRALLARVAGVDSSRDLDDAGFARVMDEFARLGFVSDAVRENLGRRHPLMASPGQVRELRRLWTEYTDGKGDDRSLGKWLDRQGWAKALRFLPAHNAQKAIGALVRMTERKAAEVSRGK